jgi:hypothetical protein
MKPMTRTDARWIHVLWIGLLTAISAGLTAGYTCVVPFAALGVAAAMTLPRRQALVCIILVWLANQAAGFGLMSYPWTLNTIGWGAVLGAAALTGTLAAQWLLRSLQGWRSSIQTVIVFVVAFSVYQAILYAAAVSMLSGTAAFAPAIVAQVLGVNVVTFGGLWGLSQLVTVALSSYRRRVSASPARFA